MYEQYTDKQIVEMLKPKLVKLGWWDVDSIYHYPETCKMIATIYRSAYIRGQLGRSFIIGEKKTKGLLNTFKVGDKVKFLGLDIEDKEALSNSRFYPPVNTIGEVVESDLVYCFVCWPKGIIVGDGIWRCRNNYLEKVTEHWVPATKNNVCKGDNVRYINAGKSEQYPEFYPSYGTIGKVVSVVDDNTYLVQWPDYTTAWFANQPDIEVLLCE